MKDTTAYRVSVRKFEKMIAAGVFGEDRVELLGGTLTMMTTSPPHDYAVLSLGEQLRDRLPRDRYTVREEKPVVLGLFWRPMPDIAVVRGDRRASSLRTPRRHDVALVVEVSDTTYAKDTGKKLRGYERAGVSTYWVVDLNRRRVEVREMTAQGLSLTDTHGENESVPLRLDGHDFGAIPVGELLP
jgi:Uma2 family endonuclease